MNPSPETISVSTPVVAFPGKPSQTDVSRFGVTPDPVIDETTANQVVMHADHPYSFGVQSESTRLGGATSQLLLLCFVVTASRAASVSVIAQASLLRN